MRPIFLHCVWRSGSIYLWSRFRQADSTHCFYEPLHHGLAKLTAARIARADPTVVQANRHPALVPSPRRVHPPGEGAWRAQLPAPSRLRPLLPRGWRAPPCTSEIRLYPHRTGAFERANTGSGLQPNRRSNWVAQGEIRLLWPVHRSRPASRLGVLCG